jgi:F0F1-type ATP synthase assembly protein I
MRNKPWNAKEFGYFMSISQIGMEMAVPVALGVLVDLYFNWGPWAAIAGAVLGFTGGLAHLIALVNKSNNDSSKPKRDLN